MKAFIFIVFFTLAIFTMIVMLKEPPLFIIDTPITFNKQRVDLSKAYIQKHYDLNVSHIAIDPKMIVLHWTEDNNATRCFNLFKPETISQHSQMVKNASALNVSAHFLVDREGHIFRLMPETQMARHVIGLNYHAIGIENVGGALLDCKAQPDLTQEQEEANIKLVAYLTKKYPHIKYLIGHYEYTKFENHELWMEKDKSYRTLKDDPNPEFVQKVFQAQHNLNLFRAP